MEMVLINNEAMFEFLIEEKVQSPEQFLSCLEDGIESGTISVDEAKLIVQDYMKGGKV